MGGNTYPISGSTHQSIKDYYKNHDTKFFKPLVGLYDSTSLGLMTKSPDAAKVGKFDPHVEKKDLPTGDVKLTFVYALDDNQDAADGRILVKDEFVLSGKDNSYKSFYRSFDYNRLGSDHSVWKKRVKAYEDLRTPSSRLAKDFVQRVGLPVLKTSASQGPLTSTLTTISNGTKISSNPKFISSLGQEGIAYIKKMGTDAQSVYSLMSVRAKHSESTYTIAKRSGDDVVTISLAVIIYREGTPPEEVGKAFVRDTFIIDGKTKKMTKFVGRVWALEPRLQNKLRFVEIDKGLKKLPQPDTADAKKYIENLAPALFPKAVASTSTGTSTVSKTSSGYAFTFPSKKWNSRPHAPFSQSWLQKILQGNAMRALQRVTKKIGGGLTLRFQLFVEVDNDTGSVVQVNFKKVKASGGNSPSDKDLKNIFTTIANAVQANGRFSYQKDIGKGSYWIKFSSPVTLTVQD